MKYQALIEYEYPVDYPKPVGAAIYLHGEKIIADSVRRVKMPEVMTNGDKIVDIYEPYKVEKKDFIVTVYMTEDDWRNRKQWQAFDRDWWDAIYRRCRV